MARIRTIKPQFWTDDKLGPLDALTRLVFIGLVSQADDAGRLVDSVKLLDGLLFPYTDESCARSLEKLAELGVIERGNTASGQPIIQLPNWEDHQRIDRPNRSAALPPISEHSTNDRRNVDEASTEDKEGIGNRKSTVHASARTASEFPAKPRKGSDGQYQYPEIFEKAWAAYPDRDGSNPKVGAYSAFRARVAGGAVPDHLVRAAEHYRTECQSREIEGTPFVQQAATFFGAKEPWREYVDPPKLSGAKHWSEGLLA